MTPEQQAERQAIIEQIAELMIRNIISYAEINAIWSKVAQNISKENNG
jgi:lauroyl/myristoyl acyltransferase